MAQYCRLCHERNEFTIGLFTKVGTGNSVWEMISTLAGSEVEKYDRLPKWVCENCCNQLNAAYAISIQCQNALNNPNESSDPDSNGLCLLCNTLLDKKEFQSSTSGFMQCNMTIGEMVQHLSGSQKMLEQRSTCLVCQCCLAKMEQTYQFKQKFYESEAKWLERVSYPWEKMDVETDHPEQLVVDLFATVIRHKNQADMAYCSVCLSEFRLDQLGEECQYCRLKFREKSSPPAKSKFNLTELTQDSNDVVKSIKRAKLAKKEESEIVGSAPVIAITTHPEHPEPVDDSRYKKVELLSYKCCDRSCSRIYESVNQLRKHYSSMHTHNTTKELPENSCPYCQEKFESQSALLEHQECPIRKIGYQCQIDGCQYFRSSHRMIVNHCDEKRHRNTQGENWMPEVPNMKYFDVVGSIDHRTDLLRRKAEICCRCSKMFDSKRDLEEHCQSHKVQDDQPFVCHICGKGYQYRSSLQFHHKSRERGTAYYCRECKKILLQKQGYMHHRAHSHFPEELLNEIETAVDDYFTCCGCNRKYKSEANLVQHRKLKHPPSSKPVPQGKRRCDNCQLAITNLEYHKAMYESQVSFRCSLKECAFRTKNIMRIQQHVLGSNHINNKGGSVKSYNPYTAMLNISGKFFCCFRHCGYSSTEYKDVIEHCKVTHAEKRDYYFKTYGSRSYMCPACSKGFNDQDRLAGHQNVPEKFYCKGCKKTIPTSESPAHRVCRRGLQTKCEICDKVCASKQCLKNHINNKHSNNKEERKPTKRHICFICGKLVKLLEDHMLSHENKRNWRCDLCNQRFNTQYVLTLHQKVHSNNRDYACRHGCDKRYKRHGERDRHEKLIHLGITPFACDYCPSSFVRERDLRLHRRKHTGQKLYQCTQCEAGFDKKIDYDAHCLEHADEQEEIIEDIIEYDGDCSVDNIVE